MVGSHGSAHVQCWIIDMIAGGCLKMLGYCM